MFEPEEPPSKWGMFFVVAFLMLVIVGVVYAVIEMAIRIWRGI